MDANPFTLGGSHSILAVPQALCTVCRHSQPGTQAHSHGQVTAHRGIFFALVSQVPPCAGVVKVPVMSGTGTVCVSGFWVAAVESQWKTGVFFR